MGTIPSIPIFPAIITSSVNHKTLVEFSTKTSERRKYSLNPCFPHDNPAEILRRTHP